MLIILHRITSSSATRSDPGKGNTKTIQRRAHVLITNDHSNANEPTPAEHTAQQPPERVATIPISSISFIIFPFPTPVRRARRRGPRPNTPRGGPPTDRSRRMRSPPLSSSSHHIPYIFSPPVFASSQAKEEEHGRLRPASRAPRPADPASPSSSTLEPSRRGSPR
jgi:hypothetical protein